MNLLIYYPKKYVCRKMWPFIQTQAIHTGIGYHDFIHSHVSKIVDNYYDTI